MTKIVILHKEKEEIRRSADRDVELQTFLRTDFEDSLSARSRQESLWRESMRMYEAVPRNAVKNTPVENAPNLEIPFIMMAADTFYSVSEQTIIDVDPPITILPVPGRADMQSTAEALSDFANWGERHEFNIRNAARHALWDTIILGTGVYTSPWIVNRKKTRVHSVITQHPQIHPWPIEDVIVQGGIYQNMQNIPVVHLRSYYTHQELSTISKMNDLDISKVSPAGAVGWVRSRREQLGRTESNTPVRGIYEIIQSYAYYDIDGDGYDEDMLITWDRTSGHLMSISYNPYDRRPLDVMRYMPRAYLFYGMGMPEKLRALQTEMSDIHNHRLLNMLLANTRMWLVRSTAGITDNFVIHPGKQIPVSSKDDITGLQMADVYPSEMQAEQAALALASNLVGLNEMNPARSSSLFSSRTPATTATLGAGLQNQRFASTFNSMKDGSSGAIKQCLYRYQERLLAGDRFVRDHILHVMGKDRGKLVVDILKNKHFDESLDIELTATSNRNTRESRVQILLQINQVLQQYYENSIKIGTIASDPNTPAPLREMAAKIHTASGEIIDRTLRSVDTIRDPQKFIVDLNAQIDQSQQIADVSTFNELQALMAAMQASDAASSQNIDNQTQPAA